MVDFFTNIVNNKSEHRAALPWIFDAVNNNLKQLAKDKEANIINELKKKYLERKK
ncbi:MAG: hypothetical protein ACFFDW_05035 [Candidatus Thorarchaeota archaeon]